MCTVALAGLASSSQPRLMATWTCGTTTRSSMSRCCHNRCGSLGFSDTACCVAAAANCTSKVDHSENDVVSQGLIMYSTSMHNRTQQSRRLQTGPQVKAVHCGHTEGTSAGSVCVRFTSFDGARQVSSKPLQALRLRQNGAEMAVGAQDGSVSIIRLSASLVEAQPNERATVQAVRPTLCSHKFARAPCPALPCHAMPRHAMPCHPLITLAPASWHTRVWTRP